MKRLMALCVLTTIFSLVSCGKDNVNATEPVVDATHRLAIMIGPQTITATLYDNPTSRDFISRLPLTVDLNDYGGTEKVFTPSPELTTDNSPSGMNPQAGDIALFAPWGNIVVYYRNGTSSGSLIPIGRIENGINALSVSGTIQNVRFELTSVEP